jgi:flagellar basal-body rod protein FlgF
MDRIAQVSLNTMRILADNQRIASSNLANINTVGFRRDINTNIGSTYLMGDNGIEDRVFANRSQIQTDTENASISSTGNPLDTAINGDGFFVVQGSDGKNALSRRGDFQTGPDGILRNGDAAIVQGDAGPITVPPYDAISIGKDGTISYRPQGSQDNTLIPLTRLTLVKVPSSNIERGLDGLLRPKTGGIPASDSTVTVTSGALESSNVNPIDSMVELIQAQRSFELQVKLISTTKELDTQTSKLMSPSS